MPAFPVTVSGGFCGLWSHVVSMPHEENTRSMNACDAGAAIASSAKAANLLNASGLFCPKINASGVAFLSAASAR